MGEMSYHRFRSLISGFHTTKWGEINKDAMPHTWYKKDGSWLKWKKASRSNCDHKIATKFKSMFSHFAIHSDILYGREC